MLVSACENDDPCSVTTRYQDSDGDGLCNANTSLSDCDQTLSFTNAYSETISGANRVISANSIPDHMVGLFGSYF